jgi:hypothetical protein
MDVLKTHMQVGYWSDASRVRDYETGALPFPDVHAVTPDEKPLCGALVDGLTYSLVCRGPWWPSVDCNPCKDVYLAALKAKEDARRMLEKLLG